MIYDIDKLKKIVYEKLRNGSDNFEKRYNHTLNVYEMSLTLVNRFYKDDNLLYKASVSAILHDYCKYETIDTYRKVSEENNLEMEIKEEYLGIYHSILGPYIISKELGIDDNEILDAIRYHTIGKDNMTNLEKVIYVADYIEKGRKGESFEKARSIALYDIDKAVEYISKSVLNYLKTNKQSIYR